MCAGICNENPATAYRRDYWNSLPVPFSHILTPHKAHFSRKPAGTEAHAARYRPTFRMAAGRGAGREITWRESGERYRGRGGVQTGVGRRAGRDGQGRGVPPVRHPDSIMASVAVGLCWACGAARAGDTRRPAGKGAGRRTVPPYGRTAQKLERNGMFDRVPGRTIRPVPDRGKARQRGRVDPRGTGRSGGGPFKMHILADLDTRHIPDFGLTGMKRGDAARLPGALEGALSPPEPVAGTAPNAAPAGKAGRRIGRRRTLMDRRLYGNEGGKTPGATTGEGPGEGAPPAGVDADGTTGAGFARLGGELGGGGHQDRAAGGRRAWRQGRVRLPGHARHHSGDQGADKLRRPRRGDEPRPPPGGTGTAGRPHKPGVGPHGERIARGQPEGAEECQVRAAADGGDHNIGLQAGVWRIREGARAAHGSSGSPPRRQPATAIWASGTRRSGKRQTGGRIRAGPLPHDSERPLRPGGRGGSRPHCRPLPPRHAARATERPRITWTGVGRTRGRHPPGRGGRKPVRPE